MKKVFEFNQKVYCLYVNVTSFYISFKIEQGKFLGAVDNISDCKMKMTGNHYVVEHSDEDVNYLNLEDIFLTENDAIRHLNKIFEKKLSEK